jgi:hypothetical protein
MTPALTAAAERLITLPEFRWMPGMVDTEGRRFVGDTETAEPLSIFVEWLVDVARGDERAPYALPDLTDPATLGCVLAMVCDAWSDPGFTLYGERFYDAESTSDYFKFLAEPSHVNRPESLRVWFSTRGECLVHALAAAGAK